MAARKRVAQAFTAGRPATIVAELRVHVQLFALLVLLVEVIEAGDQVEAAVKPLLGRRDELQFVVLALRIECAGPRQDGRRREDHVTVELVVLPVAIVVDQANGRTAADIPRQGAVDAPLLVIDVGSDELVHVVVVEVGVRSAETDGC